MTERFPGHTAWVRNSLQRRATDLRLAARRCRTMYPSGDMAGPASFVSGAYERAAQTLDEALQQLHAGPPRL